MIRAAHSHFIPLAASASRPCCAGNAPVLSKVYMRMLKLDGYLADGDCTLGLPDYVKRYVHELAIAR